MNSTSFAEAHLRGKEEIQGSKIVQYNLLPGLSHPEGVLNRVPLTGFYISLAFMKIWQSIEAAYPMAIIGVHLRWAAKV